MKHSCRQVGTKGNENVIPAVRKRESRKIKQKNWIPASAGMTAMEALCPVGQASRLSGKVFSGES